MQKLCQHICLVYEEVHTLIKIQKNNKSQVIEEIEVFQDHIVATAVVILQKEIEEEEEEKERREEELLLLILTPPRVIQENVGGKKEKEREASIKIIEVWIKKDMLEISIIKRALLIS